MGNKYTFLFGAGAEGDGQLNMPSGADFKRELILAKGVAAFSKSFMGNTNGIFEKEDFKVNEGTLLKHNSSSVLYQTIKEGLSQEYQKSDELKQDQHIVKLFPEEKYRNIVVDYLKHKMKIDGEERDTNVSKDFMNLYKTQFYDEISKEDECLSEKTRYFLENAGIYSYFDEFFNYLRKPKLYPKEVLRVFKIYYAAYLCMLRSIINASGEEKNELCKKILNGSEIARKDVVKTIDSLQKKCIDNCKNNLYYNAVRDFMKNNAELDFKIVTTNYTSFVKVVTGISDENIFYLHGKLNLFESLRGKEIKELCEFRDGECVFPYLLVQSGVKPIINHKQIETIYKGSEAIINAETLIILGYGLNSDDEHILNMLRERVGKNRKIVYFIHINKENKDVDSIKDAFDKEKERVLILLNAKDGSIEFMDTDIFNDYILQLD